jgi:hypothetical protein
VRSLAALVFLALTGCAVLEGVSVDEIAGEALSASRAPAAEQKAALARAQEAFTRDTSVHNRLRLATLLAVLPAPARDDARALELLGPVADPAAAGTGRYAALLSAQIMERQRLAREVERLRAERSAAEKEHAAADKERDKREEALRQQLEALRTIERSILEREEKLRKRQR